MITTLYINWYGPYTKEEIMEEKQCSYDMPYDISGNGLYLIMGKPTGAKTLHYYFGITEQKYKARYAREYHEKLEYLYRDRIIYLGKIIQPQKYTRKHLELAEFLYIYFSQNDWLRCINEKKTCKAPTEDCSIISNFYNRRGNAYERMSSDTRILIPEFMRWDASESNLYYTEKLTKMNID